MAFEINQDALAQFAFPKTDVDIVYCIDATSSMRPCIDTIKTVSATLHEKLKLALNDAGRTLSALRIKVIAFRDAYCDGPKAFEVSRFFDMSYETDAFMAFLNGIKAKGGGDLPESSLEALSMAMQSEWCSPIDPSIKKRHIIVLFTDASAHPLEQSADGTDKYYPILMPKTYADLIDMWGSAAQGTCMDNDAKMDPTAKRLAIYAPATSEPWSHIADDMDLTSFAPIQPDRGGADISTEALLKMLSQTAS